MTALVLSEEQLFLRQTAREFLRENAPVAALRRLRDQDDPVGFSRELWREMAELGWAGILFPEDLGGAGLGYRELGVVLEEAGRTLVASPLLSTVALCGSALLLGGNETQRKEVLSAVAAGERVLALALEEGPRHRPERIATRAERRGGSFVLVGEKRFVLDGHVADQLVVVARTSGAPEDPRGLSLFLVPGDAPGVERVRTRMVDSRNAANVRLDRVEVPASALLGEPDDGRVLLERVLDRGRAALSAEMLGGIEEAFERTLAYLKERKQFGQPIGSFQALKHRAARMFCEIELTRSAVLGALAAADADAPDLPELASVAKARTSDTFFLVGNEAIQMHGGIGMTDEQEIGFFLKRARVAQHTLGDAVYHRDRYARLHGY